MLRRTVVPTISLLLVACAPSVPRPAEKTRVPDAAADLSSASATDGAPAERIESRPAPATVTDALTDDDGAQARTDVQAEVRPNGPPDVAPDSRTGVDAEVHSDTGAQVGADGGADGGPDARTNDGPPRVLPRAGEVVIDELLVNPAGTDTNREFIEIVNTSALALDLRLLHVADAANELALDAGVLAPGGLLVLGQSLDPTRNGGAPIDLSFGNTISLNNPGDSITLCLGPCAEGLILDQVSWTSDLGAAYDGHAAIVDPASGAFCPAGQSFGTAGSFGSPGQANPPCAI